MKHYDNIEHFVDGYAVDRVIFHLRSKPNLEYVRHDPTHAVTSVVGAHRVDVRIHEICGHMTYSIQLGKVIRPNKQDLMLLLSKFVIYELIEYFHSTRTLRRKFKVESLRDRYPNKEEDVKAIINYGIEMLYFSKLDPETMYALTQKLFDKHTGR